MVTSISLFAVITFLKRFGFAAVALAPALALLSTAPSHGGVIYTGSSVVFSGTAAGGQAARATFTSGTGGVLKLLLENTSASASRAPRRSHQRSAAPCSPPLAKEFAGCRSAPHSPEAPARALAGALPPAAPSVLWLTGVSCGG